MFERAGAGVRRLYGLSDHHEVCEAVLDKEDPTVEQQGFT